MRTHILLFSLAVLFISSSSLLLTRAHSPDLGNFLLEAKNGNNQPGINKAKLAAAAAQWRFDRLKDENGNYYPSYIGNAMGKADLLKQMGMRSGLNLQWQELGPDNVGGRTRAILIDKRDPTDQTIYAGGVSGGMWKSTDGGNTWHRLVNWNQWLAIASIAQGPAPDYTIYIGTGEGFSDVSEGSNAYGTSMNSGTMGDGIFTLDSKDNPIMLTPDIFTNNYLNPVGNPWTAVNRIAVNPTDATQIIAATYIGLYESLDAGATWNPVQLTGNLHTYMGVEADDVKWAKNGVNIYASVGGLFSGTLLESANGGDSWSIIAAATNPGYPTKALGRIEIALAPSNDSILYLSIATPSGCTYMVCRSADAGSTWTDIGNEGPLFDPMTSECQGWYDNIIAVNPFNPNKIYNAGVYFYTWSDQTGWSLADAGLGASDVNPNYVHPDKHAIVFAENDSNLMFIGCDGGIYKSTDAADDFPFPNYTVKNRGYNVTQNYGIAAGIDGDVLGGSQDNGTNYINYLGNDPMAAQEVIGGDGIFDAISHINPKFYFGGVYYADVERSGSGGAGPYSTFFDIKVDPNGQGTVSACDPTCTGSHCAQNDAQFITPFLLGETKTADNGLKQVPFVAGQNYNSGDVITAQSAIANYPFQVTLSEPLNTGDTIYVSDPVRSRIFLSSYCGVWVTSDALNLGIIPRWFKLTYSMAGTPASYANSMDGDVLYVGTGIGPNGETAGAGNVYRFGNLNARCDTTTYPPGSTASAIYPFSSQYTVQSVANGRPIEGIAVDPDNNNHVVATVAGYSASNQPHVYESHDGGNTWVADTAGLPNMPVYTVTIHDSTTFIIGTELGMWSWDGSQWHEENNGDFPRVPVFRMIEKELYTDNCPVLYLGTHGRGMWRSTTLTPASCNTEVATGVTNIKNNSISDLNIFPNPVHALSHISLTLDTKTSVTLRIFDMTGKMYKETAYTNTVTGKNLLDLDASGLSSGTYLLAATIAGARTESRLFVVVK